jgi:predicted membrane metal-binding protein
MLGVAWAARALDREAMALDLLATACALILLAQPRMLFDLSFQLSALAVAGMVTAGAGLADRVRAYLPRAAALPVCAGIGAQAAVAPLLFQATGLFRPVGLVSGLLVAPLASVLLIGGLIDLAVPPGTPFFHTYLRLGLHTIYRALDGVLRFFALARPGRSWVGIAFLWALVAATLAVRPLVRGREP